ncbi:glyoxylate reductase/hydroxypyruvate reductase [Diprion similis]|uniref:glyoxylate reductase/hydroxypyruvate reductase n=1 Tax=Diprion similis TaxID=362088 RepID=UPI001EF7AC25|nr:glyoxylate reductase/hydroxypyruvate reductase [Diprion similis]
MSILQAKMIRRRVLVTSTDMMQPGIELLKKTCEVLLCPVPELTKEEISAGYPGPMQSREDVLGHLKNSYPIDGIVWSNKVRCDSEILDLAGPSLKAIVTMSSGFDHMDVDEIKRRGIQVGHSPFALDAAVAEVGVMLALSASRRAHEGRLMIERGQWESRPQWLLGHGFEGATVGIVGLGGIGRGILKRLSNFEVKRFLYAGRSRKPADDELGAEFVHLDNLLRRSDFVFVACALTNETRQLFDAEAFAKMKRTAVLVNVARGPIVDHPELIRALRHGTIFAAGLDVTDPEPLPANSELLQLPNAVITPHMGSCTVKARADLSILAAQSVLLALSGESMPYPL